MRRVLVGVIAATLVVLAPAVPAGARTARITVRPTTGLTDGEILTIVGRRFHPNAHFGIAQCNSAFPTDRLDACLVEASGFVTDSIGHFKAQWSVKAGSVGSDGGTCDSAHDCLMVVYEHGKLPKAVTAAIQFS